MTIISPEAAARFALEWLNAWNRHDLDAVLDYYHDELELSSPLIAELTGEPSGVLRGKSAVRGYWSLGLEKIPDLHFELVDVLAGVDRITLYYRGHRGMVAELLELGSDGRVIRAQVCYGAAQKQAREIRPPALDSESQPVRTTSIYPTEELRQRVAGRSKTVLGDALGLQNFGVNRVRLKPGAQSALRHWHSRQDEFIYVLAGSPTLVTEAGEQTLAPELCAGFPAGRADGHCLINHGDEDAVYLEVGDRLPGDRVVYPDEDLAGEGARPAYRFTHKDGREFAAEQNWNPEQYAENAHFVPELGKDLIDLLTPRPGDRILDLGCGDGVLTEDLAKRGCRVVGIDASAAMIAAARARGLDARVMDATDLVFSAEFDAVFSNAALHWMHPPQAVIAGVWRALKPGGRFVGEFGGEGNVAAIVAALEAALAERGLTASNPWFFPAPEAYRTLLEANGFRVDAISAFQRPTPLPGDVGGWLRTFAQSFVAVVPEAEREPLMAEVMERLRPVLCDSAGHWTADYMRLRFSAKKIERSAIAEELTSS